MKANPQSIASRKPQATALHQQIRQDIEQKILQNEWQPGHRIPFEHELMVQYDCSRMTVNKAISSLAEAGFLVRRRRQGTFVTAPDGHTASLRIPDLRKAIHDRGFAYSYRAITCDRHLTSHAEMALMKIDVPVEIIHVVSLHLADKQPFALEDRQISLATAPSAAQVDFAEIPPSSWLLSHVPWTNADHAISVTQLSAEHAKILNVEVGAPCLKLERRTWSSGGTITHTCQYYPEGHLMLHAQFIIG